MDISSITQTKAVGVTSPVAASAGTSLNADDFLKLLTTQLMNQNPLEPMKDTDFMAQMASFTSLEQMRTLSQEFKTFSTEQRMTASQGYLGKRVTVAASGAEVTGTVTSVRMDGTSPKLTIGGVDYDLAAVKSIQEAPAPAPAAASVPENSTN